MFEKCLIGKRKAALTIEISLSIIMCLAVLFLILSLFGSNLQAIAVNGGLQNFFKRNNDTAKTYYDKKYEANNPAQTQVNVQIVADQGLNYYISSALATIEKYKTTAPKTQAQLEDLARAAAIAKVTGNLNSSNDGSLLSSQNIYFVQTNKTQYVYAGNKKLSYSSNSDTTINKLEALTLVKEIISTSNSFN